jgi:Lipocalin-like domain
MPESKLGQKLPLGCRRNGSKSFKLEMRWNEVWTGTTVIRDVTRDGDKLIYTTRPAPFSGDGKMSVVTVVWEKVK